MREMGGRKGGKRREEQVSGELTLLMKVGRRDERDGRKEGSEAKGGTVGRAKLRTLYSTSLSW